MDFDYTRAMNPVLHFIFNGCMELNLPFSNPAETLEVSEEGRVVVRVNRSEVLEMFLKKNMLPVQCVAEVPGRANRTFIMDGISSANGTLCFSGFISDDKHKPKQEVL